LIESSLEVYAIRDEGNTQLLLADDSGIVKYGVVPDKANTFYEDLLVSPKGT
jgi:hypothetical protein